MCVRSDVLSGVGGIVWLPWYVVDVLSVCAQEHFGGSIGGELGNLLMRRCVSLS